MCFAFVASSSVFLSPENATFLFFFASRTSISHPALEASPLPPLPSSPVQYKEHGKGWKEKREDGCG